MDMSLRPDAFKNFLDVNSIFARNTVIGNETVVTAGQPANHPQEIMAADKLSGKTIDLQPIKDEFVTAKKHRGLFERSYDFLRNITGLGFGHKKIAQQLEKAENGEITQEEAKELVNKYKKSNENARENFGNIISVGAAGSTFFGLEKLKTVLKGRLELDALNPILKGLLELSKFKVRKSPDEIRNSLKNFLGSKVKTRALVIVPLATLAGGIAKYISMKFDRIGSKKYSIEDKKSLSKGELKIKKKELAAQKRADSFKNFTSGMLNGLLMPLATLGGGLIGVPAFLAANTGTRYLFDKSEDKSLSNFGKNLKDSALFNLLATAAVAVPMFRSSKYLQVLEKNVDEVVKSLKDVQLQKISSTESSSLEKMQDIILDSPQIKEILSSADSIETKVHRLTEANIFAVKFKQIQPSSDPVASMLQSDCPATRTIEEATQFIQEALGNANYTVIKNLGTGTVAETYLARGVDGKEVAIKILKKGISQEKILRDKEAFRALITKGVPDSELTGEQRILLNNLEDMADKILKEVDLQNEANAALQLAKTTKKANVVVPIEAKNGVYVMEKASGISVKTLKDYFECIREIKYCEEYGFHASRGEALKKQLAEIKAKAPEFEDFELTPEDIKKLLDQYIEVQTEQFVKLNRDGKIIHGDIHPGNIFFDIAALRSGKKAFTLIDTGNVINLSRAEAKNALQFTTYIKQGNYKDIARTVTSDAILPEGMTREQAITIVEEELKKYFTDNVHNIDKMTIESTLKLTDSILNQKGIIPNDTQATLNKSKKASMNSFMNLLESFFNKKTEDENVKTKMGQVGLIKDFASIFINKSTAESIQEFKNLLQMSPSEMWRYIFNRNKPATNSSEYLTYKFKQDMQNDSVLPF